MPKLRKKELKEVFDSISHEFSQTRHHPWPEVVSFIKKTRELDVSLDLGCGNGRHMKELAKLSKHVIGVDFSRKMLKRAKKELMLSNHDSRKISLIQADVTEIPFKNCLFDTVLCIATLHHLPSKKERLKCLNEIYRTLKPGKTALISVWSIEHEKFDGERKKIQKNNFDYLLNWRADQKSKKRYYHIFTKKNLLDLLSETEFDTRSLRLSSGNYYVELSK